ncbi:MAG: VCBS repeat-containing protein [Aphanocapsa lilacina HA4352-LM1]|jgi:hypothetical protein|nr:VCBS repeat-containing protein [Aphanocapsa lilacina HA4352-LM1]
MYIHRCAGLQSSLPGQRVRLIGCGLAAALALSISPAQAQIGFAPALTFGVGDTPRGVTVGDLDGNGTLDILTTNLGTGTLSSLLGNGDGTFANLQNFAVGSRPYAPVLAELNGDGLLDAITANSSSANLSVLISRGNGGFAAAVNYPIDGTFPADAAAGDLDGDGDLDIVSANRYSDTLSVLSNNGNGTFGAPRNLVLPARSGPSALVVADLDGDGDLDLVTANVFAAGVSVFLNNGNGTFSAAQNYPAAAGTSDVVAGDLDGDGDLDLMTANRGADNVSVLLGGGDGTFGATRNFAVGNYPLAVAVGDLDGDGDLDGLTANRRGSGNVSVLPGNGSGGFGTAVSFDTGGDGATGVEAADFDGDGDLDLAVINGFASNVGVLINTGDGVVLPVIDSITPRRGPVGTEVTITGTGFTGTTAVTFGGASAAYTVVSGTQITAIVPAGATSGPIAVTTPAGTATSARRFRVTS